jgi:hypothetical protein
MDDKRITSEQAEKLGERIGPTMNYLMRVRDRMDKTGLHRDELYELVSQAFDRMHHLSVALHYRHIGHGVGKAEQAN